MFAGVGRVGRMGKHSVNSRGPSLALDFSKGSDSRLVTNRAAGGATYFDATGTLQLATANTPRIDYGYLGGATSLGLLVEEQRTNSIRNPRAEGAVVGTPGTLPTNWTNFTNVTGSAINVIGSGTEAGIPYVDIQFIGTSTNTSVQGITFDSGSMAVVAGQNITSSTYSRLVAGSYPANFTYGNEIVVSNNVPAVILDNTVTVANPTGAALATQRQLQTLAIPTGGVTATTNIRLIYNGVGGAFNFTLRIGTPQLEIGAFATSPILPAIGTPAATTRAADLVSMLLSSWFAARTGSVVVEAQLLTTAASSNYQGLFHIDDGSVNNRIEVYRNAGTSTILVLPFIAGAGSSAAIGDITPRNIFKVAATYNSSGSTTAMNGTIGGSTASLTPSNGLTTMRIGQANVNGLATNGYIRKLRYFPRVLSSIELQQQTT
jgi:hypothetical protein